jgi:hypothetical protein
MDGVIKNRNIARISGSLGEKKDFQEVWKFAGSLVKLPKFWKFGGNFQKSGRLPTSLFKRDAKLPKRLPRNFLARVCVGVRVFTWNLYTPLGVYINSNVNSLEVKLNFQRRDGFFGGKTKSAASHHILDRESFSFLQL